MPRILAHGILLRVFRDERARVRELLLGQARAMRLNRRDLDLARELAYGVLRHEGALTAVLELRTRKPLSASGEPVRAALLIGAYQLLLLDRIPPHAAVGSAVDLVKRVGRGRAAGFVNAVLRRTADLVAGPPLAEDSDPVHSLPRGDGTFVPLQAAVFPDPLTPAQLAARWSHPVWLVERLLAQHGTDAALQVLAYGSARPPLSLRPAPGCAERLREALSAADVAHETEGACLLVRGAGRIDELPGWDDGWFAVQDATSAEVVPLLAPEPDDAVLDLCAAPGGKTVALREAVGPGGLVLAVDASERRLERLRTEVARRGYENVAVLAADVSDEAALPRGVAQRDEPGFDGVVVDAPCSNSGVLGRRPEARRRLDGEHRVEALAVQAARLLGVAVSRVRAGGRLVYATCSVDRRENEDVVREVLAEHSGLELAGERTTLPVAGRRDGGYAALLRRG